MQAETLASFAHSAGQTSVVAVSSARTAVSPPVWGNQAKLPGNFSNSWTRQEQPAVLPYDSRKKICNQECGCSGYKNNQVPTYTICV
ncbi:hypothetical protein CsSME_00011822 [Camellia sinensis var. sinensis]